MSAVLQDDWLGGGCCCGLLAACPSEPRRTADAARSDAATTAEPATQPGRTGPKYQCPMHPQVVSDKPGTVRSATCSLFRHQRPQPLRRLLRRGAAGAKAMDLAPITLDEARQQQTGLKTAVSRKQTFGGVLRAAGRFAFDETRVHHIHTRFEAYVRAGVRRLHRQDSSRRASLLSLYSPDLYARPAGISDCPAPEPWSGRGIPAWTSWTGGSRRGSAGGRAEALLWNISWADIRALEASGQPSRSVKIYAPSSGYVVAKTAVHGYASSPRTRCLTSSIYRGCGSWRTATSTSCRACASDRTPL